MLQHFMSPHYGEITNTSVMCVNWPKMQSIDLNIILTINGRHWPSYAKEEKRKPQKTVSFPTYIHFWRIDPKHSYS